MLNLVILASGSGTNAQAIMDKIAAGILDARVSLVVCNRPGAGVIGRAEARGIPCLVLDHKLCPDRESFDRAMLARIREYPCDLVALAGYMRLLTAEFLEALDGRVVNIHPALLPSFPGIRGIRDAWEYGAKLAGPSVHFVEEKMDSGPLIIQAAVPCPAEEGEEALAARIHAAEHRIYPQALQWIAEGRDERRGRRAVVRDAGKPLAPATRDMLACPPLEEGF